jgi:hypothetical protein
MFKNTFKTEKKKKKKKGTGEHFKQVQYLHALTAVFTRLNAGPDKA